MFYIFYFDHILISFPCLIHDGKARKRAKNKNLVPKNQKSANNSQKGPKVAFVANQANDS